MLEAIRLEPVLDLGIGPIQQVDADGNLVGVEREGKGDEEATLEGADLGYVPGNSHVTLQAQQTATDGSGKARRHAWNGGVASREIVVDSGDTGPDVFARQGYRQRSAS